jgi:hypothetical protein
LKLSAPPGLPGRRLAARRNFQTTAPGYENANQQRVISATGAPSDMRRGQAIYRMECGSCRYIYGCNGVDIKARLCPGCQGGCPGETLREPSLRLFE